MNKTKIIKIKGSWSEVLDDCRFTVSKKDLNKEPSDYFKKKILLSEHSPIRNIYFKWEWMEIPHWVMGHWVRHKWEKYVSTQRSDRTGVDRHTLPQTTPQNMRGEANVQHLIDTMKKRLCFQASKETREYAMSLKQEIGKQEPFIADVLVPTCIYRGGCSEYTKEDKGRCMFFDNFVKSFPQDKNILDIQDRYDVYNEKVKK